MIARAATLAIGLTGAAGFSQFPEFSQQYTQRLGGAVDALAQVVADFDASANSAGLSREDALAELKGTEFLDKRRADMTRTIARSEKLTADLALLQTAGPFTRAYLAARITDQDIARAALEDYKPALPLTIDGVLFALIGFFVTGGVLSSLIGLCRMPFRKRASP